MKLPFSPIMSLTQAAMALGRSERIDVALDTGRCLHNLDKGSNCAICVDACPADAIVFVGDGDPKLVKHDGATCVKCGLCLRVCPVEAYTGDNGVATLLAFIARQEKRAIVELGCALHPNREQGPPQANVVANTGACLAALGPSTIVALMALGVAHVILRVDACLTCPLAQSRAVIDKTAEQVESLLDTSKGLGAPITLLEAVREEWPDRFVAAVKAPPKSRRDFFRNLAMPDEVPAEAQQFMQVEVPEEGKYPPSERIRLLRALAFIPADLFAAEPLESFQSSMIAADENCTACGNCDRACPTGALRFVVDDEDQYQLSFTSGSCTACGVCISVCEPGALHSRGIPTLSDWLAEEAITLRSGALRRCRKCGAGFDSSTETDLCQVCEFRQKNPFGSRLPKGFKRQKEAP